MRKRIERERERERERGEGEGGSEKWTFLLDCHVAPASDKGGDSLTGPTAGLNGNQVHAALHNSLPTGGGR